VTLGRGEYHRFEAAGEPYAYLVPSAAIFRLDDAAAAVLDALEEQILSPGELHGTLDDRFGEALVNGTIDELMSIRAIRPVHEPVRPVRVETPRRIPLTTLVLNVTSKCNLACTYCYEYGEDRIVPETNKPRFMSEDTAKESARETFFHDALQLAVRNCGAKACPFGHIRDTANDLA
jgi:uncharacterized protein